MQPDRQLVPPAVIAIQGGKCPIVDRVSTPPPTETNFASSDHANTTLPNFGVFGVYRHSGMTLKMKLET